MPKHIQAYNEELNRALEKFQHIEDILKTCLLTTIDIARVSDLACFTIRVDANDISVLPLGRLVNNFSRICTDKPLIDDLRAIIKDRNHIAHTSQLFTLGELQDKKHMTKVTSELKEITARATGIHERVLKVRCDLSRSRTKAKRAICRQEPTR